VRWSALIRTKQVPIRLAAPDGSAEETPCDGFSGNNMLNYCPSGAPLGHHMRKIAFASLCFVSLNFFVLTLAARAENPLWIWHDNNGAAIQTNEVRFFRKTFDVKGQFTKAELSVAADDEATIYINGKEVAHPRNFDKPAYQDVTSQVKRGRNVIAVRGRNISSDAAGVLVLLEMKRGRQRGEFVVSDETWLA